MKTDAELKVIINDHFKAIDSGRQDGLNNDTLEAVLSFWKNNLGSELVFHKTDSGTDQNPRICIGFNINKSGTQFTAGSPSKYWSNFQWVSGGGYYDSITEYDNTMTFDCSAAYDNIGTYFENAYTTIEKALEAERDLLGRMAEAILEKKGYVPPYIAPDNLSYKYKYNWSVIWRPGFKAACTIYSDYKIGSVRGGLAYFYSYGSNTLLSANNSNGVNKEITHTYKKDHYYRGEGMDNQTIVDKYYSSATSVTSDIPSFANQTDLLAFLTANDDFPPKPSPIIGPDGDEYKYVIEPTFQAGHGKYRFYSKYPFCASKQQISSSGYALLTAGKAIEGSIDSLYEIHTIENGRCEWSSITSGAVTDVSITVEYYNTNTSSWTVCPYNWVTWGTLYEIVSANIPLFNTNAEALVYCLTATYINGQNIPNEIRALKGVSPVVKTYDDLTDYLTDIGNILKQSGSDTINAQDFPQAIREIDTT